MSTSGEDATQAGLSPAGPFDLTYRFDPADPEPMFAPARWEDAVRHLMAGNEATAAHFEACRAGRSSAGGQQTAFALSRLEAVGEPRDQDDYPLQSPLALVIGCADARVSTELAFGQEFNDIFSIRVAGNVFSPHNEGSMLYAARHFVVEQPPRPRSLRVLIALGHLGCGAVRAAVEARVAGTVLPPDDPIGVLLHEIDEPALAVASQAFDAVHGPEASMKDAKAPKLAEVTVYVHAAWVSRRMQQAIEREPREIADGVGVVFAVFDPTDLRVRAFPRNHPDPTLGGLLGRPPQSLADLRSLADRIVALVAPPAGSMA